VEPHGDPVPGTGQKRLQIRRQNLPRIVTAGHAIFVVADSHEPRILQAVESAERNVWRVLLRLTWIVDQVMRDEAWRRERTDEPRPPEKTTTEREPSCMRIA
jgi:hypothetical protein